MSIAHGDLLDYYSSTSIPNFSRISFCVIEYFEIIPSISESLEKIDLRIWGRRDISKLTVLFTFSETVHNLE